jgi:4-aminobutyrate aminotransferase-like enzyme
MACDSLAARDDDPVGVMGAVAAGFDSVVALEAPELDLLYDLVLARWAVTAAIIAWRRVNTPHQPGYLLDYEQACWKSISDGLKVGRNAARARLRKACKFPPYCPSEPTGSDDDQTEALLERRRRLLGKHLSLFYTHPVHVEKGVGPWLYTPSGRRLLDAYNNVTQVGHSHPHVAKAIARQAATLSTNTRYLYQAILDYTERLQSTLPGSLSACVLVNSGSEANDIAWRMARLVTGRRGGIVMEHAYHGITDAVAALSPYDVAELEPHVQTLLGPDPYRGPYRVGEAGLAERYAADVDRAIDVLSETGYEPALFMVDTSFCSNGIPDVPEGYLAAVVEKVRRAGVLVVADEVQMGFGRPGTHMWGFEAHGVMPDIVTLGKPVGNGYPLGVVVTTPEILAEFGAATELFSTFGGNPVASAAGLAVLEVIEQEQLMDNARVTGERLRSGIRALSTRHELIGDVRGFGLLAGVELVLDRDTLEPAPQQTKRVLDLMCANGVLIGREGPHDNVLKIRPSLVFRPEHADILVDALDASLSRL